MAELGQIETAKIPASEAKTVVDDKQYPAYEDLCFRANVTSKEEAIELLTCVQAIVNFTGAQMIIQAVRSVEKNPAMLQKAIQGLSLLKLIP